MHERRIQFDPAKIEAIRCESTYILMSVAKLLREDQLHSEVYPIHVFQDFSRYSVSEES